MSDYSEEEQRIFRIHAPRFWQALRDWLGQRCQALNAEKQRNLLEFELSPPSGAKIRRIDPAATLQVQFDEGTYRIRYSCGAGRGEYLFELNTDKTLFLRDPYYRSLTPEQVGEKMLNLLLGSPF